MAKRTDSDKVLKDKPFNIANNPKYDGLASVVYKFFDKKSAGNGVARLANKSAIKSMSNQQLANELHNPIFRKFKRRKVFWGVDFADMQLKSK